MQQIAEHFEVHYATVSRAIRRAEDRPRPEFAVMQDLPYAPEKYTEFLD